MQKITLTTETRRCINPNTFLGYEGENNANKLIFEFTDGFIDGLAVLKVERGETKGTIDLVKVEETYELEVKSSLLAVQGDIKFQFVITEPDGAITKYDPFIMTVKDALDADGELPEEYPSWQEIIATELAKVEKATENANKVAEDLKEAQENGEFNGRDGIDGQDGQNGQDGRDGISPTVTTEQTSTGAKITISDVNGTHVAELLNGKDGKDGENGKDGKDGTMSFEELTEEQKASLKGDKGDKGDDGKDGTNGADGYSPVANVTQTSTGAIITVTDKNGTTTATVLNGKDGQNGKDGVGKDGENGKDGLTPYIGDNGNWWIGGEDTGVKASGDSGSAVAVGIPVGQVITHYGTKAPDGYLVCDGSIYNIADYPNLANHFLEDFGAINHCGGDGITTFAVPDLSNDFPRFYHNNKEEQLSGEIGEHQEATNHVRIYGSVGSSSAIACYADTAVNVSNFDTKTEASKGYKVSTDAYTPTGTAVSTYTARPRNTAFLACIKY